jgi:hypothetical protein
MRARRVVEDGDIHLSRHQPVEHVTAKAFHDSKRAPGRFMLELPDQRRGQYRAHRRRQTDDHPFRRREAQCLDLVLGRAHRVQHGAGMLLQQPAGVAQHHSAPGAVK